MDARTKSPARILSLSQLYCISLVEGGAVMVTELAGARVLTPYFGASLYSWASTLSVTLFSLMAGYFAGGHATTKARFATAEKLILIFFLSGITVALMPALGRMVMEKTIGLSYFTGLVISQFVFLVPPIFLMGMISPLIIHQINKKAELSGKTAGTVYAVSTFGGIVFTLVFGFFVIPEYGISQPVRVLGIATAALALFFLMKVRYGRFWVLVFVLAAVTAFSSVNRRQFVANAGKSLVELSEGLLGELVVMDELVYGPDGRKLTIRKLKANNVQQNYVFREMPAQSLLSYVNFTRQLLKALPKKENVLLVGLGAGSLYTILKEAGSLVESVEIDERMYEFGTRYFSMPVHEHITTDGRYYLNVTRGKYDLIILDVIIGENVPAQLVSLECFQRCRALLKNDGVLIVEHGGVTDFGKNAFVPSVARTLEAAGFSVSVFNPLASEKLGDILFVATTKPLDVENIKLGDDVFLPGGTLSKFMVSRSLFNEREARVLTDDLNGADILLREHYFRVRSGIRKEIEKLAALKR